MTSLTDPNSEDFHKGTEDLQALAEQVERDRAARAAQRGETDDVVEEFTKTEHSDDALDAPEDERDVPFGSFNRVTHEEGHRN
jgi:hypothetical protein